MNDLPLIGIETESLYRRPPVGQTFYHFSLIRPTKEVDNIVVVVRSSLFMKLVSLDETGRESFDFSVKTLQIKIGKGIPCDGTFGAIEGMGIEEVIRLKQASKEKLKG